MSDQSKINKLIRENGYLIADGATGTNLFAMGLESGYPPELWNLEKPENVAKNHKSFIEAGSDIILTNSFGANKFRLKLHNAQDETYIINYSAAEIANNVAKKSNREIIIAGSIGPSGELIAPLGDLSEEDAINGFSEQIKGLVDGGVDLLWIETMSAEEELNCAIKAGKQFDIPMICTYSFDTHGKSMMGLEPKDLTRVAESYYPAVIGYGANCGIGAAELIGTMICLEKERKNKSMFLVAKSNCGIPEFIDGDIKYTGTPELMAKYAGLAKAIGVDIIGGCCGTKAEHIEAMSNILMNNFKPRINTGLITKELGGMSKGNTSLIEKYLNPKKNKEYLIQETKHRRRKRNT